MQVRSLLLAAPIVLCATGAPAETAAPNQVVGTWRMVSATLDPDGAKRPAYGERPNGLLVFTPEMRFIEVLTDADTPRFASPVRGEGTDAENRDAMSRNIGFFGTYTVDRTGAFAGNRVDASTFPNWVGDERTREQLVFVVSGDRMSEAFTRPDGTRIAIEWARVK